MEIADKETERKLVIAFDAKRLFNNFTGLGNYSRTLVKNLQTYYPQHDYHLFTPKIVCNDETDYFRDDTKFIIHTPKNYTPVWRTFGMAADVNTLNPDIFHGLSHEIPFGINRNIKTIVTFHDLIYEKFPKQFGFWDRTMYRWKYRSATRRVDHIVAISQSTKDDLTAQYGISEDKIDVVYQSCHDDFQTIPAHESKVPESINLPEDYLLYVGSLIERKGMLQIVIALASLPAENRRKIVVVGNGDKNYVAKVKDLIKYYRLEDYFIFIEGLSNQDLISVYDRSFALVYPSVYEGFGIPVIESLFRGKPVITSDISAMPEAAGPGAILVNPYEPSDIAKAMLWLNDENVYRELAIKGQVFAAQHFSSMHTAQQLMELYLAVTS